MSWLHCSGHFLATTCLSVHAVTQVLTITCYSVCTRYSRLGFPSLETFCWTFNREYNHAKSFMTWSSKTWTQVKMIVKTWATGQRIVLLRMPSFDVCNLDLNGQEDYVFHRTWSDSMRYAKWPQVNMIVKTWQPQVWNLTFFFQDLVCQVLKRYVLWQLHVPKSWQWLPYSRLGFPSHFFCDIEFQQYK